LLKEIKRKGGKNDGNKNGNESSDEIIEDVHLTNDDNITASPPTTTPSATTDNSNNNNSNTTTPRQDKKIRYITEIQVKALHDEWLKRLQKKDGELKTLKKKCAQYMQKNEMNRSLREDWKHQLEEMKKAVMLQQKIMENEKDRLNKEIYERDIEIVRLKQLVAMFTRQHVKHFQKNRQSHVSGTSEHSPILRAPVILRGGQRKREHDALRQMNIDPAEFEVHTAPANEPDVSENDNPQVTDAKNDLE